MCVQCVAGAIPYVGLAVGGLRAMSWQASRARARGEPARSTEPDAAPDQEAAATP